MSPLNTAKAGRSNHHVQSLYKTASRDMNVLNPDMNQPSNTANHVEPSPREPLMRERAKCDRSAAPTTGSQKWSAGNENWDLLQENVGKLIRFPMRRQSKDQILPMGRIWNPLHGSSNQDNSLFGLGLPGNVFGWYMMLCWLVSPKWFKMKND